MFFTYLVAFFIYLAGLMSITKNSPYQKAYTKGAFIAFVLWMIIMFLSQGFIVGFSGASVTATGDELETRIFITRIIDWTSFLFWHISMPLLVKKLAVRNQPKI